jgi:hypothetical protein
VRTAGTFITTKYASRADYEQFAPCGVHICRNDFTVSGLAWMWSVVLGELRNEQGGLSDHLGKGRIIVGNGDAPWTEAQERLTGDQTAYAELDDGYPRQDGMTPTDEGRAYRVTFQATFGEDIANFDWAESGVTSVQGVLIDRSVSDRGRKAQGSVWTVNAALDLFP